MQKLIRTADLRKALDKYNREEISYGKMVEMLNEAANEALSIASVSKRFWTHDTFTVDFNCEDCGSPYQRDNYEHGEKIDSKILECDCKCYARKSYSRNAC